MPLYQYPHLAQWKKQGIVMRRFFPLSNRPKLIGHNPTESTMSKLKYDSSGS